MTELLAGSRSALSTGSALSTRSEELGEGIISFTRALLFNFGSPSLEYQRLVLNHPDEAKEAQAILSSTHLHSGKNLRTSAPSAGTP